MTRYGNSLTLLFTLFLSAAALAGTTPDSGARLLFITYGDTRPSLYPFGDQAKHMALTHAIRRYDAASGGEVDAVLVTGDLLFADVPFTDWDWKPAWKALANLRAAPRPLAVYPALGNHELLTLSDATGNEDDDKLIRALWKWGSSPLPIETKGPLDPILLAQMTHMARLYPQLAKHLPPDVDPWKLRELWIQLSSDAVGRLTERDRTALESARRRAAMTLRLAAMRGKPAAELAEALASAPPRTVLEELGTIAQFAHREDDGGMPHIRLAREALTLLTHPGTDAYRTLHENLAPALGHYRALRALSHQTSGPAHEQSWMSEVQAAPDKAVAKSWAVLNTALLNKLGGYVRETTSLSAVPAASPGFVGPSWYYTDRPVPGGAGQAVRFIAANSNVSTVVSGPGTSPMLDQEAFLAEAIRSATGPVVIFDHHPPVSIGSHGGGLNPMTDLISAFREMLYRRVFPKLSPHEQKRVWAILSGHDHDYERILDSGRGTALIVSGGGGVPLRTKRLPEDQMAPYLAGCAEQMGTTIAPATVWQKAYNFIACEVRPGRMDFKVYGLCEKTKGTMDDPDFTRLLPGAMEAQLADDSKLIDHFALEEDASGSRRVVELPATGCK